VTEGVNTRVRQRTDTYLFFVPAKRTLQLEKVQSFALRGSPGILRLLNPFLFFCGLAKHTF